VESQVATPEIEYLGPAWRSWAYGNAANDLRVWIGEKWDAASSFVRELLDWLA